MPRARPAASAAGALTVLIIGLPQAESLRRGEAARFRNGARPGTEEELRSREPPAHAHPGVDGSRSKDIGKSLSRQDAAVHALTCCRS